MRNIQWKKIGIAFLWLVSTAAVVTSLAFVDKEQNEERCKRIIIQVNKEDENYFINKQDVFSILVRNGDSLIGRTTNSINVKRLEKMIADNKFVLNAEVYTDLAGVLYVKVNQRKPLVRVFTADHHSFYLDENGLKMPLSTNYAAKVLVANGMIEEVYGGIYDSVKNPILKDIYFLTQFIKNDPFWDAQIEQIFVEENMDLILIPRVGNHKIIFGSIDKKEDKFNNLMIFYKRALPKVGWEAYNTISVKFDGQIVCTRSGETISLPIAPIDTAASDSSKQIIDSHI